MLHHLLYLTEMVVRQYLLWDVQPYSLAELYYRLMPCTTE